MKEEVKKELDNIHSHFGEMKKSVDTILALMATKKIEIPEAMKAFDKIDGETLLFMAENYVLSTPPSVHPTLYPKYIAGVNEGLKRNVKIIYDKIANPDASLAQLLNILKSTLEKSSLDFNVKVLGPDEIGDFMKNLPPVEPEEKLPELGSNPELESSIASQIAEMFNDENKN